MIIRTRSAVVLAIVGALLISGFSAIAAPQSASAAGSVLVNESFDGTSVADPRFIPLGDACLTAAARPSTPPAGASTLSYCERTTQSPPGGDARLAAADGHHG